MPAPISIREVLLPQSYWPAYTLAWVFAQKDIIPLAAVLKACGERILEWGILKQVERRVAQCYVHPLAELN